MVFFRLSPKHKMWYVINKTLVLIGLLVAVILAMKTTNIELPTKASKLSASLGFIIIIFVFVMAALNRIGSIFKIKSVGFVVFFFLFLGLEYIVNPVRIVTGYMLIPLLIDDLIFYPIWLNIWHNKYANLVRIEQWMIK